ncbi:MAG: CoB--CoM heterodisulfide reductase iron-sulfur subunit A family protein [bacterium]
MRTVQRSPIPRVGVIFSQFDTRLEDCFDLVKLSRRLKSNRAVKDVVIQPYPSSREQIPRIVNRFIKKRIERVVVVGCSERLYGRLIREAFATMGVPSNFIEFAQAVTTCKGSAKDDPSSVFGAIEISIASVTTAQAPKTVSGRIKRKAAVIGGGIAGISSAIALAKEGVKVTVIEQSDSLGGRLNYLNKVFPSYRPASQLLGDQINSLEHHGVDVLLGVEPVLLRGNVGDYTLCLSNGDHIECGVIVVATGSSLLVPTGLYGYGERKDVMTQIELEARLAHGEKLGSKIVMIQCVGSRNDERPYCSRICCTASIKNTIVIKEIFPQASVTILSRGIAEYAADLDRARQMGVELIRYSPERPPKIEGDVIEVFDQISEMETHIQFDTVVLAVPMIGSGSNAKLARIFCIPIDKFGFLVEPNPRLRPEDSVPRGIFLAGSCHWPSTIGEAVVQGYGAAARALDLIKLGTITRQVNPAHVDENLCRGCLKCYESCVHGAIEIDNSEDGLPIARVLEVQCVGCGVCVSICPSGAMGFQDNSPYRLRRILDALEVRR